MSQSSRTTVSTVNKWSPLIRILHWGSVLLIFAAWVFLVLHENIGKADNNFTYISIHKAIGTLTFVWMLVHAVSYVFAKKPPYTHVIMTDWQKLLAKLVHVLLLVLLIAMPLAGILMTVYGGREISMFGLFNIPVFVTPDEQTAKFWYGLHTGLFWSAITITVGVHVAAVIYHVVIKKDNVLKRMR